MRSLPWQSIQPGVDKRFGSVDPMVLQLCLRRVSMSGAGARMYGMPILALLLGPLLGAAPVESDPGAVSVINFSFYAPPQKDPPVHIEGFGHTDSEIQFVLSNASEKSVVGVLIGRTETAPPGCATEPTKGRLGTSILSAGHFQVSISPHGKALLSGDQVHYPKTAVHAAQDLGAAYMQIQFGVTGVFFEDGTTWPEKIDGHYYPDPFDPKLVEAEAGKCADVAAVVNALESIKQVVFEPGRPTVSNGEGEGAPPHLRFSCRLEGPKAVCRLPMETARKPEPQPEGAEQR